MLDLAKMILLNSLHPGFNTKYKLILIYIKSEVKLSNRKIFD